MPAGAFYLWVPAPDGDAWAAARDLAAKAGIVVSPGEFYGPAGADHFRVAAVQPDDRIELAAVPRRPLTRLSGTFGPEWPVTTCALRPNTGHSAGKAGLRRRCLG